MRKFNDWLTEGPFGFIVYMITFLAALTFWAIASVWVARLVLGGQ